MSDREQITLTIQSVPTHAVPATIRLKTLLKAMLRNHGYRCLKIVGTDVAALKGTHHADGRGGTEGK